MACLFQRNNGIFYVVSCKRGGGRKWRSLCTGDRSEAEFQFKEMERVSKKGKGLNLREFWEEIFPIIRVECAEGTLIYYRNIVDLMEKYIGNKKLSSFSTLDFERYKVQRSNTVKKVTINKELRGIRALLQRAEDLGYLKINPAKRSKLLRIDDKQPEFLTPSQFNILLNAIKDKNFQNILLFAVLTGMREGEITALTWQDVDFEERQISVLNKTFHRTKTGKKRLVPMHSFILQMLYEKRQTQGMVFLNIKGEPLTVKSLSDRFRKYRRKAGLSEGIHFHSLRHSCISWLSYRKVPQETIRMISGHSTSQALNAYLHTLPVHLHEATDTLSEYVPQNKMLNVSITEQGNGLVMNG